MRKLLAIASVAFLALPLAALAAPTALSPPVPQSAVTVTEVFQLNYTGKIAAVAYSPNGLHLAIAIIDGPLLILNATTLLEEWNFTTQASWVSVSSLSWGPRSDKIGVGYQGGAVAVWRIPGPTSAWANGSLSFDVRGVSWSPDGRYLAAGIVHSVFIFWGECNCLNATVPLSYGGSQPAGISWSHDSDFVAVGQQALSPAGAIIALFDAKSWGKSLGWRWVGPQMDNVAFEDRSRFIGIQLAESRVEIWEVRNWSLYQTVSSQSGLEQFAWSGDGSRMVTLETEPSFMPNQTEDLGGIEVLHLGGGAGDSSAMGVSPDGATVAIGYNDGRVRLLAVGGERLYEDRTPLIGTTGDPLTFSVRSTAPGLVRVTYTDALGGRATSADLTFAAGVHTLTITVPSDWEGIMLYHFDQPGVAGAGPERIVRISDNDAPTLVSWGFSRTGAGGESVTLSAAVTDNIRLASATFSVAVDGVAIDSTSASGNTTASFSLSFMVSPQNTSVRMELRAFDESGNGGTVFTNVIPLVDGTDPQFGADLSLPGTAGGRIQLGTEASDERGAPTVSVQWRELTATGELPWSNFTFGAPSPGTNAYYTTFPLGRTTVAVEYSFKARDTSNRINTTETRVIAVVDREPPEIVIDLSDRVAFQGDPLHLGVIVRDNIGVPGVVAFIVEDGGATVQMQMTPWAQYGQGAYEATYLVGATAMQVTYSFLVVDQEGNTVGSGTRSLAVGDNDPPTIRVVEQVLRVAAGDDFVFHVEVSDRSDVGNLTVYYRRAGGTSFLQQELVTDGKVTNQGLTTARFTVRLSALNISTYHDGRGVQVYFFSIDGAQNGGTLGSPVSPIDIDVFDGAPPSAHIEVVGDPVVGSLISFDGSSSEDDIGVISYLWTVDGATAGNRSSLSWRFNASGQHTIKLTVTDAADRFGSTTQGMSIVSGPAQNAPVGGTFTWLLVAAAAGAAAVLAVMYLRRPKETEEPELPAETREN